MLIALDPVAYMRRDEEKYLQQFTIHNEYVVCVHHFSDGNLND